MDKQQENMEKKKRMLTVDEFLEEMGQFGKFQVILITLFCISIVPGTYQTLIMAFAGNNPPWKCTERGMLTECNRTGIIQLNDAFYEKRCSMNRSSWEFDQPKSYSIVTEFDLVCDKKELVFLTSSALFFGWTFGAIILGTVSDKYGRRIVLWPSLLIIIVAGFGGGFAPNIWFFFVIRLIIGFFQGGVGLTMFVMATELVGPKSRALAGTVLWIFFTLALCILGLKAYFIPRWRTLEIICSAPYLFCILFWRFCPESVRWLRVVGRIEEAEATLHAVSKFNKKPFPDAHLAPVDAKNSKANFCDLFNKWPMMISTIIQCYAWFVNGLVYYGVSLASDSLGGSLYRNFVLTSLVEFPANIVVVIACNRYGRRLVVVASMIVGGVACVAVSLIPETTKDAHIWSRVALGMLGKFCITVSFNSLYVWSAELYPTVVRSQGMGLLSVVSRIGAACAPWVAQWLRHFHVVIPFALMGGSTVVAAVLCCWLKETNNLATAEVLDDSQSKDTEATSKKIGLDNLALQPDSTLPAKNGCDDITIETTKL